jgi:hypothetical protein
VLLLIDVDTCLLGYDTVWLLVSDVTLALP